MTLASACERCTKTEPVVGVSFRDNSGARIENVNFERVYAIPSQRDLDFNTLGHLPVDVSTDSTVFVFQRPDRSDTVYLRYERILNLAENKNDYSCLQFDDCFVRSTFDTTQVQQVDLNDANPLPITFFL